MPEAREPVMPEPRATRTPSTSEAIAVIDFGSQYAQLIVRRVRECNVYCRLFPWDIAPEVIKDYAPAGFILTGGPASVYAAEAPYLTEHILHRGEPILGICYGMQTLTRELGGGVARASRKEYGPAVLDTMDEKSPLFAGLAAPQDVWMSHGDRVTRLPDGFRGIAASANSPLAAMAHEERRIYGLQFHPEVVHTPKGSDICVTFATECADVMASGRQDRSSTRP